MSHSSLLQVQYYTRTNQTAFAHCVLLTNTYLITQEYELIMCTMLTCDGYMYTFRVELRAFRDLKYLQHSGNLSHVKTLAKLAVFNRENFPWLRRHRENPTYSNSQKFSPAKDFRCTVRSWWIKLYSLSLVQLYPPTLSSISSSSDPLIKNAANLQMDDSFHRKQCYPAHLQLILQAVKESIVSLEGINYSITLKYKEKTKLIDYHASKWTGELDFLQVQWKLKDYCYAWIRWSDLEFDCWWSAHTVGHFSFQLRAGSDTFLTPLNIARWRIQTSSRFAFCNSTRPPAAHNQNVCPTALNQARYTWRHDSVLSSIVAFTSPSLESDQQLYADLPGSRASVSPPSTIPVHII